MKKILVTGTKGFIGKNMVSLLQNTISIVYELDAEYFDNPDWQSELKEHLVSILPDVIFHIGGHADTLEQNTNFIMERNFESTKIISDYCLLKNIPLIFSSSASCYGINNDYPSNLYGWSKYTAEQYVIKNGGIALRYFNVYGPHEEHKGIMASVAYQMYKKNYEDEDIKLFPKYPRRDFVYVKDVVLANHYAYQNYDDFKGHYYDVGYGEPRGFEDVLSNLDIEFTYEDESIIPLGYQFYTCSNREKWLPYWRPKYNLEDGLSDYMKYLKTIFI